MPRLTVLMLEVAEPAILTPCHGRLAAKRTLGLCDLCAPLILHGVFSRTRPAQKSHNRGSKIVRWGL